MDIKKILFVLLFPISAQVIISCCDCLDSSTVYYSNKTLTVQQIDNSGASPQLTNATSISKEAFGINVTIKGELSACVSPKPTFLMQSVYANSCRCLPKIQHLAKDSISTIAIITQNDFNTDHPANADVTDYFSVYNNNSFTSISDYIQNQETAFYDESEIEFSLMLLLMKAPAIGQSHSFRIRITLSDGRVLEEITSSVNLT